MHIFMIYSNKKGGKESGKEVKKMLRILDLFEALVIRVISLIGWILILIKLFN